jgi:hypothetical protein
MVVGLGLRTDFVIGINLGSESGDCAERAGRESRKASSCQHTNKFVYSDDLPKIMLGGLDTVRIVTLEARCRWRPFRCRYLSRGMMASPYRARIVRVWTSLWLMISRSKASVANRRSDAGLCNNYLRNRIRTWRYGYTSHASWN